jgi:DNA replicative helicase MCM subunit Mcm2 (Cdc46/Mcm family)
MEPEPLDQSSALYLETNEAPKDTVVWQRGGRGSETSRGTGDAGDVLTKDFLRKYIHYARSRVKPVLSEEAMEAISSAYAEMRSKQTPKNLPVTARSLETIIRLASAHAKSRLSSVVEESDVEEVLELLNFVLFHEIGDFTSAASTSSGTKQTRRRGLEPEEDATSGDDDDNDEDAVSKRRRLVAEEDEGAAMEAVSVDRESTRYQQLQSIVMKIGNSTGIVIPA